MNIQGKDIILQFIELVKKTILLLIVFNFI